MPRVRTPRGVCGRPWGVSRYWAFHISVVDGYGFGRDSTYLSASFQPDVEGPWDFYEAHRDAEWGG